jgi:hypothetical protein
VFIYLCCAPFFSHTRTKIWFCFCSSKPSTTAMVITTTPRTSIYFCCLQRTPFVCCSIQLQSLSAVGYPFDGAFCFGIEVWSGDYNILEIENEYSSISNNGNSNARRESSNPKARTTTQRPKRRIRNGQPLVPFPAAAVGKKEPGGVPYCSAAASHLYVWHYNRQVILLCFVPCLLVPRCSMHAPDQDLAEMHVGSVGSGAWSVTLVLSVLGIQS